MSSARSRAGLIASALLLAPSFAFGAEKPSDTFGDVPVVALDMGGGVIQPNFGSTTFTTLDTWNGQHTYYHSTGSALGFARPVGFLINATVHVFPFSFREIGFVATAEFGGFTNNMTGGSTPFGPIDTSTNMYASALIGPEAQMRLGSFFARAGVLGGGRYESVGDYSAAEWRIALRGQVDYAFEEPKRGTTVFTMGLFGGTDLVPAFGWSAGVSMTLAFL